MARIRTIKPDAFASESLSEVPIPARWTFAGLWTMADDDGRLRDEPRLVKAHVYPLDDDVTAADVREHLDALEKVECIRRYQAGGKAYIAVTNFRDHQRINRPSPSKIPAPPWEGTPAPPPAGGLTEDSVSDGGAVTEPSPPRARAREVEVEVEQGSGSGGGAEDARERAPEAAPRSDQARPMALAGIANGLMDEYVRYFPYSLPRKTRADLYEQVDSLLSEGHPRELVHEALARHSKRKNAGAGLLPYILRDVLAERHGSPAVERPARPMSAAAERQAGLAELHRELTGQAPTGPAFGAHLTVIESHTVERTA